MKYKTPFIKPSFPESAGIAKDYEEIIKNNWFTNFGPFEQRFRREAADFIGSDVKACTVANATLGLDLAIRALFLDTSRTKVLVPSFTFAAGPEVLISNGLTPVFIDINEQIQPSLEQARDYIGKDRSDVAGILLCNTFGTGNSDIEKWEELAEEYGLPLVIDSAAGFGSEYVPGERIGARGDCEIFSFHATKPFAVGEGGLITSRSETFIQKCRELENFGFGTDRHIEYVGTNAKMQEINSAIGLRQLGGFAARVTSRRDTLQAYKEGLAGLGFTFQENDGLSTVAFATVIAPEKEYAGRVFGHLHEKSVEARRYYQPLHFERQLAKRAVIATQGLTVTEAIAERTLSLPVHDFMSSQDIDHIIETIREV